MRLFHTQPQICGPTGASADAAVTGRREAPDIPGMEIAHRFAVIALKKFDENPQDQAPAVKLLLRNAVRLAVAHLGPKESEVLVRETLRERAT